MRIPSGKIDQLIYFVAFDINDLTTRKTGLTTFTVYRSRNGGAATVYTTPTIAQLDATNMPGVYSFTIDEDTTIASTSDSEEYCVHITQANMAPVTRTIELYRRDTTTGNQLLVDANGRVDVIKVAGTTQAAGDIPTLVTAVKTKTDFLPSATAGAAGGVFIAGANAATSITTALTANVIGNVTGNLSGSVGSLTTNNDKTGYALTSGERNSIADALLDRTDAIETGITPRQALRGSTAMLFGVVTGAQTGTEVFKNPSGANSRIVITDTSAGNRSAVDTTGL